MTNLHSGVSDLAAGPGIHNCLEGSEVMHLRLSHVPEDDDAMQA